jgi:hypothetical protein
MQDFNIHSSNAHYSNTHSLELIYLTITALPLLIISPPAADSMCGALSCDHGCQRTPSGGECTCRRGYALDPADNRTCIVYDQCKLWGTCDQVGSLMFVIFFLLFLYLFVWSCLFVRTFIHSSVCLFVRSFVCSFICSFIHLFICLQTCTSSGADFTCSCKPGYSLVDGHTCKADNGKILQTYPQKMAGNF